MTQSWNGKTFIARMVGELWGRVTDATFLQRVIDWSNEIQDELVEGIPLDYFRFPLKKLLPTLSEIVSLDPQVPAALTAVIAAGGSLTAGSSYKVYSTFVIYDDDTRKYIESEKSPASAASAATGANLQINCTAIPTYSGDTTPKPTTIYRRIYVSELATGETEYAEPFFYSEITDNTSTTLSITAEPTSTITPPSSSELDQISSDYPYFYGGNRLQKADANQFRRLSVLGGDSTSPRDYDLIGNNRIQLFPKLSSSASTAQRTLIYRIYRRPHEIFYDATRDIDLPIQAKQALALGVLWKGYDFRDRDGKESKQINYDKAKEEFRRKFRRQVGPPSGIIDTMGDTEGFEI